MEIYRTYDKKGGKQMGETHFPMNTLQWKKKEEKAKKKMGGKNVGICGDSSDTFTQSYLWRPQVVETLTLYAHK